MCAQEYPVPDANCQAAIPVSTTLHILHTNDFHNALRDTGTARLREAVAARATLRRRSCTRQRTIACEVDESACVRRAI